MVVVLVSPCGVVVVLGFACVWLWWLHTPPRLQSSVLAVEKFFPWLMDFLLSRVKSNPIAALQPRDEVHLAMLFGTLWFNFTVI